MSFFAQTDDCPPLWPPAEIPVHSPALRREVPVAPELDHWTSPDLTITAVKDVVCCSDRVVLLLAGCAGPLRRSNLALWRRGPAGAAEEAAALQPLVLEGFPASPGACQKIWPACGSSFLAQCGSSVWRAELPTDGANGKEEATAAAAKVFEMPAGASSLVCAGRAGGGLFCAMLVRPEVGPASGPILVAPGQTYEQVPGAALCCFEPGVGLRKVAEVPRLSEGLALAGGERRLCVWRALLNEVPEEAERGEFLAADCSTRKVACLTRGAGRVGEAAVAEDGETIVLQANFSLDRPITTHMALVVMTWKRGEEAPRPERRTIVEGQHVHAFGFIDDFLYITLLHGVDATTTLWSRPHTDGRTPPCVPGARLAAPVLSRSAAGVWNGEQLELVYGTEHREALPQLARASLPSAGQGVAGAVLTPQLLHLPQPRGADCFSVEKITYTHRGDKVTGILCERREPPLPPGAPLLVHAHGGPAVGILCSKRMAADQVRYPYRHLLMAGYRIFQPMFRGTLGFGDKWSMGNIGCQGSLEGDLGDITAGLDWLQKSHPKLKGTLAAERTGIFGGSYGGYMTIRAMSALPRHFGAGVALYGFVHNRWMSYEGGDFTWEDEYIVPPSTFDVGRNDDFELEIVEVEGVPEPSVPAKPSPAASPAASPTMSPAVSPGGHFGRRDRSPSGASSASLCASDVWPLPKDMEKQDPFNNLHRIARPLLLMHGEKDDICPLSQSQVAFHMLEKAGVPTGLIVYPGEGHGFDEPEHQQDRDRRLLAWFGEHLAGERGPVPDLRGQ